MSDMKKSKVLLAARGLFLRYGYKRVSMNDIAEAAGVSRPALYLLFKNKDEIFIGVFGQWVDETLAGIEQAITGAATAQAKLALAFELWAVRPFEMMQTSPEVRELVECSFDFAEGALREGYARFEAVLAQILASGALGLLAPHRTAHVLASAVRGLKQTANTPEELRLLVAELLVLSLGADSGLVSPL